MTSTRRERLLETFLAAADAAALARPEVDADLARELVAEAATMLDDGLALDAVDERDVDVVVAGLAEALVSADPGAALRAGAASIAEGPARLHDPAEASACYLVAAQILQI